MSDNEKTQVYRLGLGLIGVGVDDRIAEKIWRFTEALQKKGYRLNIRDAVDIEVIVDKKYTAKKIEAQQADPITP